MEGLLILLLLASASTVLGMAFPHLQSRSKPDIIQTKRQDTPQNDQNYYPLIDIIGEGRKELYKYNPFLVLVSVQALPETYGASVTTDLLTNLTFKAVNSVTGNVTYMTAHHGQGFGTPQTTTAASYIDVLWSLPLPWPITMDVSEAHSYIFPTSLVKSATLSLPNGNSGPYNATEPIWWFEFGKSTACSVDIYYPSYNGCAA